jgi:xanthine dehydrogenase YagS FAD-binding subunit
MRAFAYARATTPEDAVKAAADGAAIIAGGTEFLNWMRLGIADAEKVVDIGRLESLRAITRREDGLRIGARATLNEIGTSEAVLHAAPVLAQACLKAASAQLRNRATIGGNVLQKTRCPYFRAEAPAAGAMPWPCNKRVAGSGCAAKDSGYARLALFGWTDDCAATQPSDPAVALAVLNATVEVIGTGGARSIAMADFHLTQAEAAQSASAQHPATLENRLRSDELIVAFRVPVDAAAGRSAYVKVRERESYEYAMVSAAAAVDLDGQRIRSARIALGSIAQKPWRLTDAEAGLIGQSLDPAALDRALEAGLASARPLGGNAFKVKLARNAARRALMIAGSMA